MTEGAAGRVLDAVLHGWERSNLALVNLLRALPAGALIFHDGYHHGQIKLALKAAGMTVPDDVIGPQVWDVWRAR